MNLKTKKATGKTRKAVKAGSGKVTLTGPTKYKILCGRYCGRYYVRCRRASTCPGCGCTVRPSEWKKFEPKKALPAKKKVVKKK